MFKGGLHFLFAWRYFKAKKSTNAINIIAWISIAAMVMGTAALILVLSVFNGFEGLVKSLYSSFYPDIKISAAAGKPVAIARPDLTLLDAISTNYRGGFIDMTDFDNDGFISASDFIQFRLRFGGMI